MGVRSPEGDLARLPPALPRGPSLPSAAGLACVLFLLLVSNGRPIGAGDTRPTERVAASLVQEGNFDLDEYPEVEPPFARQEGEHRVSIYPTLSALMATPVFALARSLVDLDETGSALAGKAAASLFSALAAGVLFLAVGRRWAAQDGRLAALVFALGTSVWSTSQALWQHPAAVLFLSVAVLFWLRAEDDEREAAFAGRAGLPLALALAARPAAVALVGVLALGFALRWPRRLPFLLLWALPPALFVAAYQWHYFGSPLRHGFSGTLGRFSEPWGVGHLGLLVSPAKGLLVFTPIAAIAAIGLLRAFRRGERWLAGTLGLALFAHWLLIGRWTEWHGGECWGPRLMTDGLPLLMLFLPDGLAVSGLLGLTLAFASVAVQAIGAFSYDYRWERLYARDPASARAALWTVVPNPILFHAEERVVRLAVPARKGSRAFLREYPIVLRGPVGSRVEFARGRLAVTGAERTLGNVFLERGARVEGERLRLRGRWDGLFLRVEENARPRKLELRIAGRGLGTLYVGERTFLGDAPRWQAYPMKGGALRVRHPYRYAESGGADLIVTLGRATGEADLESVALVPPTEPEDVIRLK